MNIPNVAREPAWLMLDLGRRMTPAVAKRAFRRVFPRSMSAAFTEVYRRDVWQGGSGRGSTPDNTLEYRDALQTLLRMSPDIKRVVDLGCGDWAFSRLVDWSGVDYLGVDAVDDVVQANRRAFGERARFRTVDITGESLPDGDLVILKDVLQHWPTEEILRFLPRLRRYRYALITNCAYGDDLNTDIAMTGYRPLDLREPPFSVRAQELLRYRTDEVPEGTYNKLVLLLDTRNL
jgi:SAM-dependent methyltransferase